MKPTYLHFKSRHELLRIDPASIVYFEADGNYIDIVTINGMRTTVCVSLAQMQQLLSTTLKEQASIFVRIGKKHIVNHTYLFQVDYSKQKLVLSDGVRFAFQINIPKESLRKFKELYVATLEAASAR